MAERQTRLTVQHRITIAVAALSLITLSIVGLILYVVESSNVSNRTTTTMVQEITELRAFADSGVDPRTGEPFTSVDELLAQFLELNRPNEHETLFVFLSDGRVLYQGQSSQLSSSPKLLERQVAAVRDKGGTIELTIGRTQYEGLVQPVTLAPDSAAEPAPASSSAAPVATTPAATPSGKSPAPGAGGSSVNSAFVVVHNVSAGRAELNQVMQLYIVAAFVAVILISGVSSLLARRLLLPVRQLRQTAQSISAGDLGNRLNVAGNDDLAELGATLNEMLDRLEAAFETQRQFLDDAGHELRTPLTILRGHLELMDAEDPDEVVETRSMLLDETDRMSRLVDELLILARARRPDFVRAEPLDLALLLNDVLAKARALGERDWQIDGELESGVTDASPEAAGLAREVILVADRQRLTQALLQMAQNAVDHTEEGQTIAFGAAANGDSVDLWVRDVGVGVPAELGDAIFERFRRGRLEGKGFGLGLSIIRAIAEAHGGTVVLDDTEVGARFRMILPTERARAEKPAQAGDHRQLGAQN